MKKLGLLFLLIFTNVNYSYSCSEAFQKRLFPIGKCNLGYVFVQVDLIRKNSLNKRSLDIVWSFRSSIKIFNENKKEIKSDLLNEIKNISDSSLENELKTNLLKGILKANNFKGFKKAIPQSIQFCNYRAGYSDSLFLLDSNKNILYIKVNKKEIPVFFDSLSIALKFKGYINLSDVKQALIDLKDMLLVNSIRKFIIGNKTIMVYHLEIGEAYFGFVKNKKCSFRNKSTENTFFCEPVLHHGKGFDFFVVE